MPDNTSYTDLLKRHSKLEKDYNILRQERDELLIVSERFNDIANNESVWIWEVDVNGRYTYSSPIVETILGYSKKEIIGKKFYDLFHPDEKDRLKQKAYEIINQRKGFVEFVNANKHKDGSKIILSTSGIPIFNKQDKLIGYRGADVDITRRHEAEMAVRLSEEHLRSLMECASGFAVYRLINDTANPHKLQVVFISPSVEDILGIPEPTKFETWFDYMHPEDVEWIIEANQNVFYTLRFDEVYRSYNEQKKEYRWIHAIATGGKIDKNAAEINRNWNLFVNGILIDVTEQKLAMEKLKKNEADLRDKASALEELNTTLNVLLEGRDLRLKRFGANLLERLSLVMNPCIGKLSKSGLNKEQAELLDIIKESVAELQSYHPEDHGSLYILLTPSEIQVAHLIKQGKSTKEIADILNLSCRTIGSQRGSIRKKLGLRNRKSDLRSFLLSLKE